jgi:hypothetical protein
MLRSVQNAKDFHDILRKAVDDKVRQAGEYKFSGAWTTTRAALPGKFRQQANAIVN